MLLPLEAAWVLGWYVCLLSTVSMLFLTILPLHLFLLVLPSCRTKHGGATCYLSAVFNLPTNSNDPLAFILLSGRWWPRLSRFPSKLTLTIRCSAYHEP